MRTRLLVGGHFDEREVALQQGALGDVLGEPHIDKLFKAGFEAMRALFVGVGDDGHARNLFIFRGANRQRVDVNGQTAGQRGDTVQDPGLVLHISDKCLHKILDHGPVAVSTSGLSGRRIISCSAPPAGTMGYTESSCSTRKSIRTLSADSRAERMVVLTPARGVRLSPRMPKSLASAAKSGATSGVAT